MLLINFTWSFFMENVPDGTLPRDQLRLQVQGEMFTDNEWADDATIDTFLRKFPDCILAVVDTRHPQSGFTCYFFDNSTEEVITYIPGAVGTLPLNRLILRIVTTGNHFMSVRSHPAQTTGLITTSWSA